MKKILLCVLLIIIVLLCVTHPVLAQEIPEKNNNKVYCILNSALSIPYHTEGESLYVGGNGAGSILYKTSKSVHMGIELSAQFNPGKTGENNFQQLSTNYDIIWYPSALFRSIAKDKAPSYLNNFYIGFGMGHSFSSNADSDLLNNIKQSLGYRIPLKNKNNIQLQLNRRGFILKRLPLATYQRIFSFIETSVGYSF